MRRGRNDRLPLNTHKAPKEWMRAGFAEDIDRVLIAVAIVNGHVQQHGALLRDGPVQRRRDVSRLLEAILTRRVEEVAADPVRAEDLIDLRAFSARLRRDFLGHELKSYEMLQAVLKIG